MEASAEFYVA